MTTTFTGLYDDNGLPIHVGETLVSKFGYEVIVYQLDNDEFAGKLVCKEDHSCANIPYCLNKGKGHVIKNSVKIT